MPNITTDEEWATRHQLEGDAWIENYWKSRDHPHRFFLVERICQHSLIRRVLEIGCGPGANLYNLAKKLPNAEILGIDVNPVAVKRGNELLKTEGIRNVQLEVGKAQELKEFANKSFDVVFTDAVLIYISPDEINRVVEEMLRVGIVLVLNEWHCFNKGLAWLSNMYYWTRAKSKACLGAQSQSKNLHCPLRKKAAAQGFFVGHWVRDYRALLGEFVPKGNLRITKLPKDLWDDRNWQRWGAIVEVLE